MSHRVTPTSDHFFYDLTVEQTGVDPDKVEWALDRWPEFYELMFRSDVKEARDG